MGLDAAGQLLHMVGNEKNRPLLLQYKVAEALGQLVQQQAPIDDFQQFQP